MEKSDILAKALRCLEIEKDALAATASALDERFAIVAQLLQQAVEKGGKLIFSGIGKNAPICQKLVGTFNSIGAPSSYLDPVGALHGDLGLCREDDILLAFSNKGETSELLRMIPMAQRFGLQAVAITSRADSSLARLCDATLPYAYSQEACPLDLAPTASAIASMAIGDALAMVLLEWRSFGKEDFARLHPGGSIGRALASRVEDIMRGGDSFAWAEETAHGKSCLEKMTELSCGSIALVDGQGKLSGVLTDGDIRRLTLSQDDFMGKAASEVMTRNPVVIQSGSLAAEALKLFETHRIDDLLVVDSDGRPVGLIAGQDLSRARLI